MNFFHWDGQPYPEDLFDGTERSMEVELGDGSTIRQSSRADYERALREAGKLGTSEELIDRPDLVGAVQADWHSARHNGCVFSAHMSAARLDHGWETYIVRDASPAEDWAEAVAELVTPRLAAPAIEIISLVFPSLDEVEDLATLIRRLGELPDWELVEIGEDQGAGETVMRLGLRRKVELGYDSEVLGFGPHPGAAITRQAPFTELAIRAKPPPRHKDHGRAVMADIRLDIPGAEFGQWGADTKELRQRMLGTAHDQRGKAKVSFVIPKDVWAEVR